MHADDRPLKLVEGGLAVLCRSNNNNNNNNNNKLESEDADNGMMTPRIARRRRTECVVGLVQVALYQGGHCHVRT
jgi:hypothetical protein